MTSKRLTIFEGPDGAGKTTAARAFAETNKARYVHFGALPHVHSGLARMYAEAMLPAVLGYQNVVMDRSWLSELPYGEVYRGGQDRILPEGQRMLERLAMRCQTVVVQCDPGWDVIRNNYQLRRSQELLKDESQLKQVYEWYHLQKTSLPVIRYNYTDGVEPLGLDFSFARTKGHPLHSQSAGNLDATTILVGESFGERKDGDPWYQWPFASFSRQGCSWWLTQELSNAGINECDLLWINADQPQLKDFLDLRRMGTKIVALGRKAVDKLSELDIASFYEAPHPQFWKRFNHARFYPLIEIIKEMP